jgi:uncharacterized protein (TIGR02145 family)
LNIVSKPLAGLSEGSVMKIKLEGSRGRFVNVSIVCSSKENMISDIDGNFYKTVKIGNQWWMAENLKTTKFNDGIAIPEVTDATEWLNMAENHISAYCWYDNNTSNKIPYGALYNWESAGDERICPEGWHLPDSHEYYELCLFLDQNSILGVFSDIAGGMLKEAGTIHWQAPNTGATNESGFTALPGGIRNVMGSFSNFGTTASFWSDNGLSSCSMSYNSTYASFSEGGNEYGRSIRCVKD